MKLSERFDEAWAVASGLHRDQMRKRTDIPYLAHLMAVAAIVLEHGGDEEQAIAALFHDAPEDQGGRPTLEMIRSRFGDRVAGIVEDCSDTFDDPKPEWLPRKVAYLEHLEHHASEAALAVSAADKLHNLRSIRDDFARMGDDLWERFSGRPGQQLWYFQSLARIYDRRLPGQLADTFAREAAEFDDDLAGIHVEEPPR